MTHEVELKFRIPAHRLAALRRAVATRSARQITLAARYMETPDGDLGRARVALRLRQEGDGWVQTLKAEGRVALQRLEHNVALPADATPALDIARHDGTEAGARLREVLAGAREAVLREHYATAVQRTYRPLRHQGALIELALDEGEIRAGGLVLPVCEIEFELLEGPASALLDLAAQWARRFDLWLDVRSKSERGHALAHQAGQPGGCAAQAISRPARARALALPQTLTPPSAAAAMLSEGLQQALANASQIADGSWQPDHLHQLRVGLRRLRSVLRLHAALLPGLDAVLAADVARLFQRLGPARDRDVRAIWLWPALHLAGAPAVAQPEPQADGVDLPGLLAQPDTQQLWLRLLALTLDGGPDAAAPTAARSRGKAPAKDTNKDAHKDANKGATKALRLTLQPALQTLLRQVQRDAGAFATLDDAARHRLRRRIKRLRYAAELSASLWPPRRLQALLGALAQAQRPLGVLNDAVVAAAHCRALAAQQPEAWFAVGWLAARHDAAVADCAGPMAALASLRSPWAG